MLVADLKDDTYDFVGASGLVRGLVPAGLTVRQINREQFGNDEGVRNTILQGWNAGPLLVNYMGTPLFGTKIFSSHNLELKTRFNVLQFVFRL